MRDECSNQQLNGIIDTVDGWRDQFMASPEFGLLTRGQQREVGAASEFFAHYAYCRLGVTPEHWEPETVVECLTEILPRKISADHSFFGALSPALAGFFTFLGRKSILPNGERLAEAARGLEAMPMVDWGERGRSVECRMSNVE